MPGFRLHGEEEISHSFEMGVAQPSVHACADTMRMTYFVKLDSVRALQMGGGKWGEGGAGQWKEANIATDDGMNQPDAGDIYAKESRCAVAACSADSQRTRR